VKATDTQELITHWHLSRPTTKKLATAIWTAPRTPAIYSDERVQAKCQFETFPTSSIFKDFRDAVWLEYELMKVATPVSKRDPPKFASRFRRLELNEC
jgi:hypothetical protein